MQRMLVTIPADLYRQMRHFAVDANKSQSEVVVEALKAYLKDKEKKPKS